MWPVLWMTFFFGRRGAIAIIACIGVAHLATLLVVPAVSSFPGRWVDVMVSVAVVAGVVLTLVRRNDQLLDELRREARTDALTGLLNRRGFEERSTLELARARREATPLAVVTFDIDFFKRVNDEWGHEVGDRVLARTAELLAEQSREIDVVARFGGEEFVVLLPDCDGAEAELFANRVREAVAFDRNETIPSVRLSAGILAVPGPTSIDTLVQGADSAMYRAKRSGRDRTVLVEQPLGDSAGLSGPQEISAARF
jgi:diguanylate cyclase (GGDEF)-like protein